MAQETIKEKVLSLTRKDPFLTIEEIGAQVETTPRYVRTILSEAKVSLMGLRKSYAKKMEKRLQPPSRQTLVNVDAQLQIRRLADPFIAQWFKLDPKEQLWQVSQVQKIGDSLAYVQLTTYQELTLKAKVDSLRQLLISGEDCKIMQKTQFAEVVEGVPELSKVLQISNKQPLLKLYTLLYNVESTPIAVEVTWLPTEGIYLRWGEEFPDVTLELAVE